jgi:predicted pyridoxine 5'-phosphate oxidase superfamily flavin-nucleotide-binding protein
MKPALKHGTGPAAKPGEPHEPLVTDDLRAFLAQVDTAFLATASADGAPYVQHRGGPRGFIRAVDDDRIGFADLAGNRQYLSIGNLAENPRVCLFLMDYARRRRVKVWGTAEIVPATGPLAERLALPGVRARVERLILITVTRWDVNCPAHIPQKVDAAEVAPVIARLEARIAELERELAVSRAGAPSARRD